jgi:hypothetical protein
LSSCPFCSIFSNFILGFPSPLFFIKPESVNADDEQGQQEIASAFGRMTSSVVSLVKWPSRKMHEHSREHLERLDILSEVFTRDAASLFFFFYLFKKRQNMSSMYPIN